MLYIFDLDGTLITSYMDRADKNFHAWQLLPERAKRIAELRAGDNRLAVVTNQGGVAFGLVSVEDARKKLTEVAGTLDYAGAEIWEGENSPVDTATMRSGSRGELEIRVCYADARARDPQFRVGAERRKPSGAMLREVVEHEARGGYPHEGVLYVGDRPEDEAAARDAGVAFIWAHEFFGA